MVSTMVIKVRYFGTSKEKYLISHWGLTVIMHRGSLFFSVCLVLLNIVSNVLIVLKVKVGGRERYLKAPIDENGKLSFEIGGLREKICSTCYLPPGSDITLVYIDEDGDVVTLVDDDDLQDALRQRLKSFRIDVLMNDDKVYRKSSSKRRTQLMMDSDGSSLGTSDNSTETNKASTSSSAIHDHDDTSSDPTVACFKRNYSEANNCECCGCKPITIPSYNLDASSFFKCF